MRAPSIQPPSRNLVERLHEASVRKSSERKNVNASVPKRLTGAKVVLSAEKAMVGVPTPKQVDGLTGQQNPNHPRQRPPRSLSFQSRHPYQSPLRCQRENLDLLLYHGRAADRRRNVDSDGINIQEKHQSRQQVVSRPPRMTPLTHHNPIRSVVWVMDMTAVTALLGERQVSIKIGDCRSSRGMTSGGRRALCRVISPSARSKWRVRRLRRLHRHQ